VGTVLATRLGDVCGGLFQGESSGARRRFLVEGCMSELPDRYRVRVHHPATDRVDQQDTEVEMGEECAVGFVGRCWNQPRSIRVGRL
jgi:hypothetical protein